LVLPGYGFQPDPHAFGQRRIVEGHRVVPRAGDPWLDGGAVCGCSVPGDVLQPRQDVTAHVFFAGPDGARDHDVVGDDVMADAAVDGAEGEYGGLVADVHLPADDRLGLGDDLGGRDHRVHAAPRAGAMGLAADDPDVEAVRRGHGWSGADG